MPNELDVVAFRESVGKWPAGTSGTVIHAFEENGLVEIVDDDGGAADVLMVPFVRLNVVWRANRALVH